MKLAVANPLFAREVKERMRSFRAPFVLTAYLALLALVVFATERSLTRNAGDPFASAAIGRTVFHYLLFFQLMLVCFLVPAFVSGSVSTEREKRTLQLLQVTLLRPRGIVLGKLAASMSFVFLLVLATIPLVSVSFILGGVTPLDVLRGFAMVIFTGFAIAMMGIGISANLKRTMSSTVLAYALVGALTVGTALSYGLIRITLDRNLSDGGFRQPAYTLVLNPFLGTASAIQGRDRGRISTASPFDAMFSFLSAGGGSDFQPLPAVARGDAVIEGPEGTARIPGGFVQPQKEPINFQSEKRVPLWVSYIGWYLGMSALGYLLALIGVRAPGSGIRIGSRRIAVGDV